MTEWARRLEKLEADTSAIDVTLANKKAEIMSEIGPMAQQAFDEQHKQIIETKNVMEQIRFGCEGMQRGITDMYRQMERWAVTVTQKHGQVEN